MRRPTVLSLLTGLALIVGAQQTAQAALMWSETTEDGAPTVHWVRGATLEEVSNLTRSYVGDRFDTVMLCRQDGWFAYVGSSRDNTHGVSCGASSARAAVYKARQSCEINHGRCDIERIGYDNGKAQLPSAEKSTLPRDMIGETDPKLPMRPLNDPLFYNHWTIFDDIIRPFK